MLIFIAYFLLLLLLIFVIYMTPDYIKYQRSEYKQASKNSFLRTMFNKGNYGEFLTFSYLEKLKGYHKLLTNLYIPKEDGSLRKLI